MRVRSSFLILLLATLMGACASSPPQPAKENVETVQSALFRCLVPGQCDDHNPCTTDLCGANSSCSHRPVKNGTPCDDGSACTSGESCRSSFCIAPQTTRCSPGSACNTSTGACEVPPCDPPSPLTGDAVLLGFNSKGLSAGCLAAAGAIIAQHFAVTNGQILGQPVTVFSAMRVGSSCSFILSGRVTLVLTTDTGNTQETCSITYDIRITSP